MYYIPGYVLEKDVNSNKVNLQSIIHQNEIQLDKKEVIDEYRAIRKNGTEKIESELEKFLYEQEMLCSELELKNINERFRETMYNKIILTIMPTENCNFNCTYCYEKHDNMVMGKNVIEGIKKFLYSKSLEINKIDISWFGGEPTLKEDIVVEISEYVKKLVEEKNTIIYTGSMTTNGYLLDERRFKRFLSLGINNYQITLDGFNHDKTRPLKDGSPTLEKILGNLRQISCLPEQYHFKIILRRNILPGDSMEWYDYLNKEFGDDKRFSILVRTVGDFGGESVKKMNIISETNIDKVLREHCNYIRKLNISLENEVADNEKVPFSDICYAAFPYGYVFRANGNIEKCTISLGNEKNVVGKVTDDGQVIVDEKKNMQWSGTYTDKECYRCKSFLSCNNLRCPQKNIVGNTKKICSR